MHGIRQVVNAMNADNLFLVYSRAAGGEWYLAAGSETVKRAPINRKTAESMVQHKTVIVADRRLRDGAVTHFIYKVNPV